MFLVSQLIWQDHVFKRSITLWVGVTLPTLVAIAIVIVGICFSWLKSNFPHALA